MTSCIFDFGLAEDDDEREAFTIWIQHKDLYRQVKKKHKDAKITEDLRSVLDARILEWFARSEKLESAD